MKKPKNPRSDKNARSWEKTQGVATLTVTTLPLMASESDRNISDYHQSIQCHVYHRSPQKPRIYLKIVFCSTSTYLALLSPKRGV